MFLFCYEHNRVRLCIFLKLARSFENANVFLFFLSLSPGEVDLAEVGKTVFVFRFVQFPDHFQSEQTFFR